MIDLLVAISLWCGSESNNSNYGTRCRQEMVACVLSDKKKGDGKEWLEMKLEKCLRKSK